MSIFEEFIDNIINTTGYWLLVLLFFSFLIDDLISSMVNGWLIASLMVDVDVSPIAWTIPVKMRSLFSSQKCSINSVKVAQSISVDL